MQNWYNLSTYYDVSFSHEMSAELAFLKAIIKQYCKKSKPKLLEPACGTGRLIIPLLRSGFDCTGFDLNKYALDYLNEKLQRQKLKANVFNADMANFYTKTSHYDGAVCTVDTFRHLLTEKKAEQHFINVANALKRNGIYILGLHLIPEKANINNKVTCWTARRGGLTVRSTMTMMKLDMKRRTETLKIDLIAKGLKKRERHTSIYKLRTYTLKQFNNLLSKSAVFKVENVFDHYYDVSKPIMLDEKSDYAVFILKKI